MVRAATRSKKRAKRQPRVAFEKYNEARERYYKKPYKKNEKKGL